MDTQSANFHKICRLRVGVVHTHHSFEPFMCLRMLAVVLVSDLFPLFSLGPPVGPHLNVHTMDVEQVLAGHFIATHGGKVQRCLPIDVHGIDLSPLGDEVGDDALLGLAKLGFVLLQQGNAVQARLHTHTQAGEELSGITSGTHPAAHIRYCPSGQAAHTHTHTHTHTHRGRHGVK